MSNRLIAKNVDTRGDEKKKQIPQVTRANEGRTRASDIRYLAEVKGDRYEAKDSQT